MKTDRSTPPRSNGSLPDFCLSISETAKIYDIPKPTLRFWEKQGLLHSRRNRQNDYREYDVMALDELNYLLILKNAGIPLNEMKQMQQAEGSLMEEQLDHCHRALEDQIATLLQQQANLMRLQRNLLTIRQLQQQAYIPGEPPFNYVTGLRLDEPNEWHKLVTGYHDYVFLPDSSDLNTYRDGATATKATEPVLWSKAARPHARYLSCLTCIGPTNPFEYDVSAQLADVRAMGHEPRQIILQYLLRMRNERTYDYYQMWIEIE